MIPADASVLEVGCGEGDLLAALPNARRMGIDYLPERSSARGPATPTSPSRSATRPRRRAPRIESAAPGTWDAVVCDRLCHSVLDVKALLAGLKRQLAPGGRIYLTAFNYLWEVPVRLAEMTGWKRPAPTANWLSDSDFRNLFDIAGLEVVRYEDRLLLPLEVPGVVERAEPLPGARAGHAVRVAVPDLRAARRGTAAAPRRASVSVVVPTRNEAGNVAAAMARTPVMGTGTELIFVEGHSTDDTWETIQKRDRELRRAAEAARVPADGEGEGGRRPPRLRARRPATS